LSPYPSAWCFFSDRNEEWNVKIYELNKIIENHNCTIGSLISSKKEMKIAVENGYVQVLRLQFPGKKKMSTAELLNGMAFSAEAKVY
jgi:methionyl-tRNA formyltransferase